jgi:hypothetical protein
MEEQLILLLRALIRNRELHEMFYIVGLYDAGCMHCEYAVPYTDCFLPVSSREKINVEHTRKGRVLCNISCYTKPLRKNFNYRTFKIKNIYRAMLRSRDPD